MSQYNHCAANNAGRDAFDPELAPFLPTMAQSGGWNTPVRAGMGMPIQTKAALPPNVESESLHAKAGSTGKEGGSGQDLTATLHSAHTCATCSASFRNNHQLEQHATKTKHKAYVCSCRKAFTKLSALKRHVEESTQARDHQCPLCDNEFKRPGHVEQHLRLVHQKSKDAIKKLLGAQKPGPRQGIEQASTDPAAVPVTGSMDAQADQPMVIPGGPWTGPIGFSATGPTDHPDSRPRYFSAFSSGFPVPAPVPTPATDQWIETPAFAPQSLMTQAPELHTYSAYAAGAVPTQTGLPADPAPALVGYPAAHMDGGLGLLNVDPVLASMNHTDGFGMPALENEFMGDFTDFDLNNFGF